MKSLRTKMALSFGLLILIICMVIAASVILMTNITLQNVTKDSLVDLAEQGAKVVRSRLDEQINALEAIAAMQEIKDVNYPISRKLEILNSEVERCGHIRMGIADLNGDMVATDGTKTNISDRVHFTKPMNGESYVSDPIVSKANGTLIMAYGAPIKHNGQIVGVLVAVRDGNHLSEIASNITFGEVGKANIINKSGITIAHKNNELVLNMDNITESAKTDPKLASLAKIHAQMVEGKKGSGEYEYGGVQKITGFAPIEGTGWSIALEAPEDVIFKNLTELRVTVSILSTIFELLGVALAIIIAISIVKPIGRASKLLSITATGDFTQPIPDRDKRRKDEIGVLTRSIEAMQNSVKSLVNGVIGEAAKVDEAVAVTNNNMEDLNKEIIDVSATTEELSAGTEETAASTEEMNATSIEISAAIESIAEKAQEGAITASEISRRANEIKSHAIQSHESASKIYSNAHEKLKQAIEQSKAAEQINVLSDAIMQITSQTNLLALNAAIEAARAGESGRGFAVVADEIRTLAEDSKKAVNEIQEVTKEVLSSVTNLAESSDDILDFIDKKVLVDYQSMVNIGEYYNKDAELIQNMVTDFSATSQQLAASVQNMIKAINEITVAANEGASGASDIAMKTAVVTDKASEVIRQLGIAQESSAKLVELVSKFIV